DDLVHRIANETEHREGDEGHRQQDADGLDEAADDEGKHERLFVLGDGGLHPPMQGTAPAPAMAGQTVRPLPCPVLPGTASLAGKSGSPQERAAAGAWPSQSTQSFVTQ